MDQVTAPLAHEGFTRLVELDTDLVRCPYPLYEELRTEAPVSWSDRLNAFVVSRYDDVLDILRDPITFSSAMASGPSSVTALARRIVDDPAYSDETRRHAQRRLDLSASPVLLMSDPPLHKRQRTLVSAGFTPRRIAQMEAPVREIATKLVDAFVADGEVELVSQFSIQLPMTVIATVLGVPPSMMHTFKTWSNAFTQGVGALEHSPEALAELFARVDEFYDYFTVEIEKRRAAPADDLLTDLLAARLDGEQPLTLDEILQMLVQFLVAGNETTTNLLSTIAIKLAADAELQARVRADDSLIPALVEECLRMEAPVQGMFRTTTRDVEIRGTHLPAGSTVYLVYGSANRDPDAFSCPERLDLDDDRRKQHLAFGRGEHFCLGANIAKLEAWIGIDVLLERLDDLALAAGRADEVTWNRSFVLHGITELPLTFTPRP